MTIIEDQTGGFFGSIGQAISNNNYIGPNLQDCIRKEIWNGYWCRNKTLTILMFMSVAPDYNKRLYSPVYLTTGKVKNKINSFIEWNYNGITPLQTRESKFISLVQVNKFINMTNTGANPTNSEYWLSKRNELGSPNDFVIIQLQLKVSLVIQISVNNIVIQPGITKSNDHYNLLQMTSICGANNFFSENSTIHFIINGDLNCKVRVSLKNTLKITTSLSMKKSAFSNEKFLKYATSSLGGNPQNYKILKIKKNKKKRLLQEDDEEIIMDVDWAIVDDAEIGTESSLQSEKKLNLLASSLESFNPPPELGMVLSQSTKVETIDILNYASTETLQDSNSISINNKTTIEINDKVNIFNN